MIPPRGSDQLSSVMLARLPSVSQRPLIQPRSAHARLRRCLPHEQQRQPGRNISSSPPPSFVRNMPDANAPVLNGRDKRRLHRGDGLSRNSRRRPGWTGWSRSAGHSCRTADRGRNGWRNRRCRTAASRSSPALPAARAGTGISRQRFAVGLIERPEGFEISGDACFEAIRLWPWAWPLIGDRPLAELRGRWLPYARAMPRRDRGAPGRRGRTRRDRPRDPRRRHGRGDGPRAPA